MWGPTVTVVAAIYFAYLAVVAILRLKLIPAFLSVATILCISIVGMPHVMPLVYLLVGYWLPGMVVGAPNVRVEQRLLDFDRALLGPQALARFESTAPRIVIEYLEFAYLLCYAVVPAGYAYLLLSTADAMAVDRYWQIVLLASFCCYGVLPWIPTRVPRVVERRTSAARSWTRRVNVAVLDRASVQWNTFPSGHSAASMAAALAVGGDAPLAGGVFGVVAVSIAVGSVVGRYHYVADAIAGAVVAVAAFVMVSAARGL